MNILATEKLFKDIEAYRNPPPVRSLNEFTPGNSHH